MTTANPASITTDGITITASSIPGRYHVSGPRIDAMVTAILDDEGDDRGPVVTTWFDSRADREQDPTMINGIAYVGHYAMTSKGFYVGAYVSRLDGGVVTGNARSTLHKIGAAVATLHATPANVSARKLAAAEAAVAEADRKLRAAKADALAARDALAALQTELA